MIEAPASARPRAGLGRTVLALRAVSRSFPGVRALGGVEFDLRAGEVHALIGENGAGKSTLIKVIGGLLAPDGGELRVGDERVERLDPAGAQALGIQVVHQELSLVGPMTVAENVNLGAFPVGRLGRVDRAETHRRTRAALALVGLELDVRARVQDLPIAERQLVEIARALSRRGTILVLDEPTSALGGAEAERLFAVIRELAGRGVGVLYVSHRLAEIESLADRITVLRDGRRVAEVARGEATASELVKAMIGREESNLHPRARSQAGEVVLSVEGLSTDSGLADVSLDVRAGEVVGGFGLVGSGLGALGRTIFGAEPAGAGSVTVASRAARRAGPRAARRLGLALLTEDRKRDGLIAELSVRANMTLAALDGLSKAGWVHAAAERREARRMVERLRIKTPSLGQPIGLLSGGNQQKVLLARWFLTRPRVLILAEPTRGVDVGARAELYRIIAEVAESGMGVLILSTDAEEVAGVCGRAFVLRRGRRVASLDGAQLTQRRLLEAATQEEAGA